MDVVEWWFDRRKCCCGDTLKDHHHYSGNASCNVCPCERFQWRITKWVY